MQRAAIELPDGARVPAAPGHYRVVPAPDLNEMGSEDRFLLEYDFPFLIVREAAARKSSEVKKMFAHHQVIEWTL